MRLCPDGSIYLSCPLGYNFHDCHLFQISIYARLTALDDTIFLRKNCSSCYRKSFISTSVPT